MARMAIIGSNDLGKLIAHYAVNSNKWDVVGFFDNNKPLGLNIDDYGKVLGDIDNVEDSFRNDLFDFIMVGVGYTQFAFRKSVFERFKGVVPFANLIHRSAYVDASVSLGEGIFILPGCAVDMGVTIGHNVLLNLASTVSHESTIGAHCFVAPGVTIAGKATVGERCFLGVGSTILDNVSIPSGTVIGGGAVVVKSLMQPGTYVGIPAKEMRGER